MTPELIQALENIGIDAIKILGPAIIAAVVAYKVAKAQSEASLKQTDKRNEFDARKAVYDLLIQRQEKLNENHKQASENLAFVMGVTTGLTDDDEDLLLHVGFSNTTLRTVQRTAQLTKEQFEKQNLTDKAEFGVVKICSTNANAIQPATNFDSLRTNSLTLMPIYEDLNYALNSLVEWEIEKILDPYIKQKVS